MHKNAIALGLLGLIFSSSVWAAQAPRGSVSVAPSEDLDLRFSGDFRVRYESNQNPTAVYNANDSESHANHRFKLNSILRKGETLSANLTLIHAAEWGSHSGKAVSPLSSSGTGDTNDGVRDGTQDSQNMVLVNRAWGWWRATEQISVRAGRIGLEIADGTTFAENDYEQTPTSHDGMTAQWDLELGRVMIFSIKAAEYGVGLISHDAERNIYGASLDVRSIPAYVKLLNLHVIQVVKDQLGSGSSSVPAGLGGAKINEQRIGTTLTGDSGGFLYRISGVYAIGDARTIVSNVEKKLSIAEFMIDSSFGFQSSSSSAWKILLGFHTDSGDKTQNGDKFQAFESFYYDHHENGGAMEVLRWGNLTYGSLGFSFQPADDIELVSNYYYFMHSAVSDPTAAVGNTATPTTFGPGFTSLTALPYETELGHELDLILNKSFDSGLKLTARMSGFVPGSAIRDAGSPRQDRAIVQFFTQGGFSF